MKEFTGRVAVVTGAASGIGRAMAERFATAGMKIVLADVEENALKKTEGEMRAQGASTLAVVTDVSQAMQRRTVFRFRTGSGFASITIPPWNSFKAHHSPSTITCRCSAPPVSRCVNVWMAASAVERTVRRSPPNRAVQRVLSLVVRCA